MNKKNLSKQISNVNTTYLIIKIFYYFTIAISIILLLATLIISFSPIDKFEAVKANYEWSITYNISATLSNSINIPFKIIQPLNQEMFNIKYAFIIYTFTRIFITSVLLILGLKKLLSLLVDILNNISPFNSKQVKNIKHIANYILIYYVLLDLILNIICNLFVTHIFSINLANINLKGVLIGGLIYVLANIFNYGFYLQNEYDTTL